jgi:hypothetical protein
MIHTGKKLQKAIEERTREVRLAKAMSDAIRGGEMTEEKVPYGNEPVEERAEGRLSGSCLLRQHDRCSGEGFDSTVEQEADRDKGHVHLRRWLCTCGCHITQGVTF